LTLQRLRDRDAIVTADGLIFRVYGYWHPKSGYICDPEYASSKIYQSSNPKAYRQGKSGSFYKFYEHEGLEFVQHNYPEYSVHVKPLGERVVGVPLDLIESVRKPQDSLRLLLREPIKDSLVVSLSKAVEILCRRSSLKPRDFGVFGSLQHSFHHPLFSDLDLTITGSRALEKLLAVLEGLYDEKSTFKNEFDTPPTKESWKFRDFDYEKYVEHQRRKLIYGIFSPKEGERKIKIEFEPVKAYDEIFNEYTQEIRIVREGWIRAKVKIVDDSEAFFMPSIYQVELEKVLEGCEVNDVRRILSYVEEFRMQCRKSEVALVEGNLEKVSIKNETFRQITLSYGPRYYEQALYTLN